MADPRIELDDLTAPDVLALLADHVAQLRAESPPESTHVLDVEGLRAPGVRFWVARDDGRLVGCAALAEVPGEPGHVELKSMRTAPAATGRGVGAALLRHLLAEASAGGAVRVSLETGSYDYFAPARRLYARHGFRECGPFGAYVVDPESTFMTRTL